MGYGRGASIGASTSSTSSVRISSSCPPVTCLIGEHADRAAEGLQVADRAFLSTLGTVARRIYGLDGKLRTLEPALLTGDLPREFERFGHKAGERADAQVDRGHGHIAVLRPVLLRATRRGAWRWIVRAWAATVASARASRRSVPANSPATHPCPHPSWPTRWKTCAPGRTSWMLRSSRVDVALHRLGDVHLVDDDHVRRVDQRGVLERLVLAFRRGDQHDAHILAQVEIARADQVAHVLDEEKVERGPSPSRRWRSPPYRLPDDTSCR